MYVVDLQSVIIITTSKAAGDRRKVDTRNRKRLAVKWVDVVKDF